MLRSTLIAAVILSSAVTSALAEVRVSERNGDLRIWVEVPRNEDEASYQWNNGVHLEIYEVLGRIRIVSLNDINVMGRMSRDYDYPTDDIIIEVKNGTQSYASNSVDISDLSLRGRSDSVQAEVRGTLNLYRVSTGYYTPRIVARAESIHAEQIFAGGEFIIEPYWNHYDGGFVRVSPESIKLIETYSGGNLHIESLAATDIEIKECMVADDFSMALSNKQDLIWIRDLITVGGNTDIDLGAGSDHIEFDIADKKNSTIGNAFMAGGSGTDTVYQNVGWFDNNNTSSVEWFK